MWIFMQDAFLSVTEHESEPRLFVIGARVRGDIERVFPEADVIEAVDGDYRFCTSLPRERVSQAISLRVGKIKYPSFHNSIEDADRKAAYLNVWGCMYDEQQRLYGPPPADSDETLLPRPTYELDDPRYSLDIAHDLGSAEA
jgi:hypothetical protein